MNTNNILFNLNKKKPICVLSALAFGDLLIDCYFLKHTPHVIIVTPFYNKEFCEMLKPVNKIEYFELNSKAIPPLLFNLKSYKLIGIIKSWFELRKIVKVYSKKYTIVYNTNSLRWYSLNPLNKFYYLRNIGKNIYEEYSNLVNSKETRIKIKGDSNIVYIFPDSRQKRRTIPNNVLIQICKILEESNFSYFVVTNREDIELKNIIKIKTLNELFNLIKLAGLVVTAESMPIHLSEYFQKENFLISPGTNIEMFPQSLILENKWCTFDDLSNFIIWLNNNKN